MNKKLNVGWVEWISLPDLGIPSIEAKTDTGAKTSALHAHNIQPFGSNKNRKVRFVINPIKDNPELAIYCSAKVIDEREITSSMGRTEKRYVINTTLNIGDFSKEIEITLTNRENLNYRMILGRSALEGTIVKPDSSYIQTKLDYDVYKSIKNKLKLKRSLRIGILTREPNSFSVRRIIEEAEKNDHVVETIDTKRCYLKIDSSNPEVHYNGKPLPIYDAIIPRIGPSITFYGMSVVRQFQAMGTFCLNSSQSIGNSRDKLAAHQILVGTGIPMPNTSFANSPKDTKSLLELISDMPLVIKLLQSSQGKGVILAESKKAASGVISAFQRIGAPFIAQEFVKEANGEDVRCFVVGKKVVGSMMRKSSDDDFRSNLHSGGTSHKVRITKQERLISINAARSLGLNVAGVDIIRSDSGPKVLEVNSSPGIEGIEKSTEKNIAGEIIKYIEENVRLININQKKY